MTADDVASSVATAVIDRLYSCLKSPVQRGFQPKLLVFC